MPIRKVPQITSWSLSRLTEWETCPLKAKLKFIDRLPEPDNQYSEKGNRIHEVAANFIIKRPRKIPVELERFVEEFKHLPRTVAVEQSWAFTSGWEPCSPTDWNRAWLRMKVDAHYTKEVPRRGKRQLEVIIIDHKSGRVYPDHTLQRSLYALGAFIVYPDAVRATAAHWYLDQGVEERETWDAKQLDKLKREWTDRARRMMEDTEFRPRPWAKLPVGVRQTTKNHCTYCHFRKSNGGPCVFA